jgi:polysaccharide pyruvyl transferase WcaK-like protein
MSTENKGEEMNDAIKSAIIEYLFNEEMKGNIVNALNENIDIPFISEKTEGKILDAVYSSVEEVLKNAILKG